MESASKSSCYRTIAGGVVFPPEGHHYSSSSSSRYGLQALFKPTMLGAWSVLFSLRSERLQTSPLSLNAAMLLSAPFSLPALQKLPLSCQQNTVESRLLNGKPISWQKNKVLTSKKMHPRNGTVRQPGIRGSGSFVSHDLGRRNHVQMRSGPQPKP